MPEYANEIYHGYRFNPNKLLLDPYARAHFGELIWDPACFGYRLDARDQDLSFDERDSAPFVPKCRVVDETFQWSGERVRRRVPWPTTVVYEAHVRGYTKRHPGVREELRGTYAGLASRAVIEHLRIWA